ncbi:TPA: hypothetical protein DCX16_06305 [bacterium]|nr:hypothetical protein [bacterium]
MANPIITIDYGINYTNRYIFGVNPYPVEIIREVIIDRERQSDGTRISYFRGKKWKFVFEFKHIPLTMFNSLYIIREIPEPYKLILQHMTPSGEFIVHWINDLSGRYWSPLVNGGFTGSINFVEV